MEVNEEFKTTVAGEIPSSWDVKPLIDCCNYADYRGKTPKKMASGKFLVTARNVRDGFIDYEVSKEFVADDEYEVVMRRGKPRVGDVLITTEAPLGNVAQVDREDIALAQRIIKYRPKNDDLCPTYLKFYLLSKTFQSLLNSRASGSTAKGVKGSVLHQLPVVIPSRPEQRAIVEILNDADALIVTLDKLIAKKRDLKRAAMQQLLLGNGCLRGFKGRWERKRLSELCRSITDGTHFTPQYVNIGVPFYSVENVTANNFTNTKFISQKEHKQLIKRCRPEKGDILLTRIGSIGDTKLIDWDAEASIYVSLALLKIREDVDARYLYCYTKSRQFVQDLEARSLMNASPKKINMRDIGGVPIPVPELKEQIAIAGILLDMDKEVTEIQRRLVKTQALKQGIMQVLLTGKTRLLIPKLIAKSHPEKESVLARTHNWEFNEAVVISALASQFGTEKFPLGRKRYTKLTYLLHRHVEREARGYLKRAAGPYNPNTKYKGPEAIAQNKLYIRTHNAGRFSGFVAADNIVEAQNYFQKWYGPKVLPWLEQFRFKKNDELELLTTVDMAIQDLLNAQLGVTLRSVKKIIRNHKEWRAKLQRPIFADARIAAAIETCKQLFG